MIRGGAGLYFENAIFNNVLFDRPLRLQTGAFNQSTNACVGGSARPVPVAGGTITPGQQGSTDFCSNNNRIGDQIPAILSFCNQVKAGNPFNLQAPNPNYIGNLLSAGTGTNGAAELCSTPITRRRARCS